MKLTRMMVAGMALAMASYSFAGQVSSDGVRNMTDPRDGKIYKTVKIGKQIWMAENLNVKTKGSMCYDNDPANCKKYGRLYTWSAAQKACPSGWHLPSQGEFETLLKEVGSSIEKRGANLRVSSWNYGLDKHGFSALPAGNYHSGHEDFDDLGYDAHFWSSTEVNEYYAYYLYINGAIAYVSDVYKNFGFSVRCLKDADISYKKNNALFVSGGWFGEPKSFNPIQESWLNAWPVGGNSNLMYEPLIVLNSLTGEIEPLLGTYRPELSNDDYIVVDVNPSAKWSDGRTVTAEDVIYSFRNKPSPMIDSIGVSESTQDAERLSFYVANGAGVNRVLNYLRIVKIIPKHVFGKLVETYGMDEVKKAPFDKIPFTTGSSPIVSGPYNLKEYDANKIVLERRDEYWGNAALHEGNKPVPRYIVHLNSFYGEIGLNGLRDGRINVSTTYIPDRVMKQKNNKIHGWGKTYYQLPSTVSMLVVNATKEPLNNRYFRRAMAAAIDYNSLTKLAGLDHYTQPLQPGLIIPNLMESKYIDKRDQENYGISTQLSKEERESLVRSLLDSAGIITVGEKKGSLSYMKLKNGKKIKPLKIIAPAAWTDWMIMVEAVVADMRELGIDVHVEQVDGGEYWKKLGLGDFDLIIHKPADIAPWNRFFEVMSSKEWQPIGSWAGWNVGRYNNPNSSGYRFEVDAFLTELLSTRDDKKKKECYRRLNQIFMEDMPAIPLVYFPEEYYWYEESAWNGWPSENDPYAPPFNLGSGSGTNVLWHLKSSL